MYQGVVLGLAYVGSWMMTLDRQGILEDDYGLVVLLLSR